MKTILCGVACALLLAACGAEETIPTPEALAKARAEQTANLKGYKKTDDGRLQMPIDDAMQVVAAEKFKGVAVATVKKIKPPEAKRLQEEECPKLLADGAPTFEVDAALAEKGKGLFTAKTCNACHSLEETRLVGPGMKGFYGRCTVTDTGEVFLNDEAYFRESIKEPNKKVVFSYAPGMVIPPITDDETTALLHYLATLK